MGVPRFLATLDRSRPPSAFRHPQSQPGPPHESHHEIDWWTCFHLPQSLSPSARFLLDVWHRSVQPSMSPRAGQRLLNSSPGAIFCGLTRVEKHR